MLNPGYRNATKDILNLPAFHQNCEEKSKKISKKAILEETWCEKGDTIRCESHRDFGHFYKIENF